MDNDSTGRSRRAPTAKTTLRIILALALLAAAVAGYLRSLRPAPPAPEEERRPTGPLRVHPANPRYFADASGRAVYLTGSHVWNNLLDGVDQGACPAAPESDYDAYLDLLEERRHNFIRFWRWELTKYTYEGPESCTAPHPWPRTGPGTALDGKPKFDLSKFDEKYFARVRSRAIAASRRGMYVSIMLFEGHGMTNSLPPWRSDGHPFNAANNVNGINGDPNGDGYVTETHTLGDPAITALQQAYVRKLVDSVNDLDNLLYEISNESPPGSEAWQYEMIRLLKDYEAGKPKSHPVGMTAQYPGGSNQHLIDSPADWISPNQEGGYDGDPPPASGHKVVIVDTDHIWGEGGDETWVWKMFTRGLHPIFMDGGLLELPAPTTDWRHRPRTAMGHTLTYAKKLDLAAAAPRGELSSTGYALAAPGSEYLVYQPVAGQFAVDLAPGTYSLEWLNPDDGAVSSRQTITAEGGPESFTAPFASDAVLYLESLENERRQGDAAG